MCGIVAYTGKKNAVSVIIDGLKRLEYRGYDSAGIAVHSEGELKVLRCEGKISRLESLVEKRSLSGNTGIGHTRWATHGRPSDENAHPHSTGRVAVVHNGILENYALLKKKCQSAGRKFNSETDTEVIAHLIHLNLEQGMGFFESVRNALFEIKGSYAIAVVCTDNPGEVVIAKNASPLVIGIGEGEIFAASDVPAILPYTRKMLFLDEKEIALIGDGKFTIETLDGKKVERKPKTITWTLVQAEKGGYKHFMLKEIFEQPRAVEDTIRGRLDFENEELFYGSLGLDKKLLSSAKRLIFVACGTSYHAAVYGKYLAESIAGIPAVAEIASEFRGRNPVIEKGDIVVAISQSGETIDTLHAIRIARQGGASVVSIVNVMDSAIARDSDMVLYTHAGPEIGVASTKCFTTQLAGLVLLVCAVTKACRGNGEVISKIERITKGLVALPGLMRKLLDESSNFERIARKFVGTQNFLYLGRGFEYPIAMEGALKLKEISYIHAEAYPAGEMKHGPIALIDRAMPVCIIIPQDEQFDRLKGNLQEVRAREGRVIAVTTEGGRKEIEEMCEEIIIVPQCDPELLPFLTVIPLQMIAYYIADIRGTDVDQPRNLAKTVTVE